MKYVVYKPGKGYVLGFRRYAPMITRKQEDKSVLWTNRVYSACKFTNKKVAQILATIVGGQVDEYITT